MSTPVRKDSGVSFDAADYSEEKKDGRLRGMLNGKPGLSAAMKSANRGPGRINSTPTLRHVFRYAAASSTTVAVTNIDIFGALGVIGTVVNSTVKCWAGSFKINRVILYPISTTTNATVDLIWSAGANSYTKDEDWMMSVPQGMTGPCSLTCVPPVGSEASFWQSNFSSGVLFNIIAAGGMIVDFDVSFTLVNVQTSGIITGFTTVALGQVYYLALDGRATNVLRPVGLTSTT